jgi:hypothetical protein
MICVETRGFGGRSRNSRSSSVIANLHRALHCGSNFASDRIASGLQQSRTAIPRTRDRLAHGVRVRLWNAGQERFGERVDKRKQHIPI